MIRKVNNNVYFEGRAQETFILILEENVKSLLQENVEFL